MNTAYAPIIVFAFNRKESLQRTIESLLHNREAIESDLFVFVDGPRKNKKGEDKEVETVQKYVQGITGFKTLKYHFSETNKGLAASVISGVTEIIHQYGKVIVVEDDLVLMPNFLSYMNQALDIYASQEKIMSVSGHSCQITPPKNYTEDAYFFTRASSWGWATWKDRWDAVDWELSDWESVVANKKEFVRYQGSDVFKMLCDVKQGKSQSWAIRFCYTQFLLRRFSVVPCKSLVINDGFTGDGTNCKRYSRFKCEPDRNTLPQTFRFPKNIELHPSIHRQAMWYHSIPLRIWSRIMYLIKG